MGPIQTLDDLIDMLRRRFWLIAWVTLVGAFLAAGFALTRPHVYSATEVIQIDQPRIAGDLAATTVEGSAARRLQLIEQQLMARDTVLDVADQFGIFDTMPALTPAERVAAFREMITIEGTAAAREGPVEDGSVAALTITAEAPSPEQARDVAHELAARTIQLMAEARQAQTLATLEFFQQEEAALMQAVAELENEIARFRSENTIATTGRIEMSQAEITTVNEAILSVERQRIEVQRDLEALDLASGRPATRQRAVELERQLSVLDEQRAFLDGRLDELRATIQDTPAIEGRINLLEQRLEQYQERLSVVSARRAEAEIGHRLEVNRQAEQMRVLEPAMLPDYPSGPGRKKIAAAGAMASLFLGFVVAFFLELRHPVIRSAAQMQRELGITPVVLLPEHRPVRRSRMTRFLGAVLRLMGARRAA